mgnify:CR=1 FL=1
MNTQGETKYGMWREGKRAKWITETEYYDYINSNRFNPMPSSAFSSKVKSGF